MGRSGRLFLLLRPYAFLFVANLVATFVASVMDGATFVLLIPFLRTLFGHDPLPVAGGSAVERLLAVVVGPLLAAGSPGAALRNVVLVLVGAMVVKNVLAYLAAVSSVAIQENVVRDLRVRLFGHLQTLPLDFFQRTRAGQVLSRVINDTDAVKTVVTAALASLVQNVSLIVVYVAILVGLSWRLTLVALVCAPVLVFIVRPLVGRVRWRSREQADQRGELTSLVSELVGSIKLVRAYVAEAFEADRFRKLANRYRKGVLRAQRYALLTSPVSEVFAGAVIVLIFAVGTRLALGQAATLSPEVLIAFIAVALRLMSPVKSVANYPTAMAGALAAADRVPGRVVLVQRPGARARGCGLRSAARAGGGRGGPVWSRQDDAGRPAAAVLRAQVRRHPDGRGSHHPVHAHQPARAHGHRVARDDPAERQRAREHLLRAERLHPGPGAGGRARRQRPRLRLSAPRGLSDAPRRAGHPALGRRAPADRDRACAIARSAHPDSRRGDQRARHGVRAAGAGGHRPPDEAPHDVRHRAPARHRPTRRSDRGARRGADRGAGNPRDAVRRRRVVPPAARHAISHLT